MLFKTIKKAGIYWVEDDAAQMGAALAYYMLFSLAPLLIMAIAVVGLIYGDEAARGSRGEPSQAGDFATSWQPSQRQTAGIARQAGGNAPPI